VDAQVGLGDVVGVGDAAIPLEGGGGVPVVEGGGGEVAGEGGEGAVGVGVLDFEGVLSVEVVLGAGILALDGGGEWAMGRRRGAEGVVEAPLDGETQGLGREDDGGHCCELQAPRWMGNVGGYKDRRGSTGGELTRR
jgi:hypothetical protein